MLSDPFLRARNFLVQCLTCYPDATISHDGKVVTVSWVKECRLDVESIVGGFQWNDEDGNPVFVPVRVVTNVPDVTGHIHTDPLNLTDLHFEPLDERRWKPDRGHLGFWAWRKDGMKDIEDRDMAALGDLLPTARFLKKRLITVAGDDIIHLRLSI